LVVNPFSCQQFNFSTTSCLLFFYRKNHKIYCWILQKANNMSFAIFYIYKKVRWYVAHPFKNKKIKIDLGPQVGLEGPRIWGVFLMPRPTWLDFFCFYLFLFCFFIFGLNKNW
jgi:hypothetical protein